jgi:hypothetical protein
VTENSSQSEASPGQALAEAWETQAEYCAMRAAGYREGNLARDQARVYTAREVALRECARELRKAVAADHAARLQPLADDDVPAEVRAVGEALGASGWAKVPAPDGTEPVFGEGWQVVRFDAEPAAPQPAPELAARSFQDMLADPHEQFDLRSELLASIAEYAAAPQASANTYPSPQPAPELAKVRKRLGETAALHLSAVAEREKLRELLDEIGVMAANAPEDGDSFGVLEEITMRIAAVDLPDTTPVLAAVKRERDAARADRAHLRAALATLTDRTEGSTVLTEDERAEYRKLVDAMGPFAPGRDGAAPELAAPVTGRTPGAAAAPELADVLSKRFFHLASELENEAPESDGSAVAQTARAIARRIRKGLGE